MLFTFTLHLLVYLMIKLQFCNAANISSESKSVTELISPSVPSRVYLVNIDTNCQGSRGDSPPQILANSPPLGSVTSPGYEGSET